MYSVVSFMSVATAVASAKPRWNELEGYTFEQYMEDHGKRYASAEETASRKKTFVENMGTISHLNSRKMTWKAGVNMFTDWTKAEFKDYNRAKKIPKDLKDFDKVHTAPTAADPPLPHEVDWRKAPGVVNPVRHQGACGSCWAHATAETMSSQYNMITGTSTILSVGQINSCVKDGCNGCDGGDATTAFKWMKAKANESSTPEAQRSLTEEWVYPFSMKDFFSFDHGGDTTACKDISTEWTTPAKKYFLELNACGVNGVGIVDGNKASGGPATQLALRDVGPMAISVAAGNWQWYTEGVFQNTDATGVDNEWSVDHAVQMVGYGYDKELDENYWIVRNSWSTLWGEGGFIRLGRAKDGEDEPCHEGMYGTVCGTSGCLNEVSYPMVYKATPIKFG